MTTVLRQGPLAADRVMLPARSPATIDRDAAARATVDLLTPEPFRPTTFPNDAGYGELVLVCDIGCTTTSTRGAPAWSSRPNTCA